MTWVRFDDQFPISRKVSGLPDKAFRLHFSAIFWCARNALTSLPATDLHVYPWSLGGPDTEANLRVLRRPCNSRKGASV